jgi:hypothetical protein
MSTVFRPGAAIKKAQSKARRKAEFEETLARGRAAAEKTKFDREQESSIRALTKRHRTSRSGIPKDEDLLGGEPFNLALSRLRG